MLPLSYCEQCLVSQKLFRKMRVEVLDVLKK